jgi:hypothetical protein
MKKKIVSKKISGPEIYDLILNLIILGFLIAIIVLLLKCNGIKQENFESVIRGKNRKDKNWRDERFFRKEFVNPITKTEPWIATAPIHQHR